MLPGWSSTSGTGTWWARQKSSTWWPSTIFGPVQPLGERRTIIGQRGRWCRRSVRASAGCSGSR